MVSSICTSGRCARAKNAMSTPDIPPGKPISENTRSKAASLNITALASLPSRASTMLYPMRVKARAVLTRTPSLSSTRRIVWPPPIKISVSIRFGEASMPGTDETQLDLPQAKFTIDMIQLIHDRTVGNRSEEEDEFLGATLYDLRMKYVAKGAAAI